MAVTSDRGSVRSSALQMLGGDSAAKGRHRRGESAIEIRDIIASGERCAGKIGSTFIPTLQKPMTYTFQKDVGKHDFVNAITRGNAAKLGPNHYKIHDEGSFVSKDNLKKVKFAFTKDKKISCIEQEAKKRNWVPASSTYTPNH